LSRARVSNELLAAVEVDEAPRAAKDTVRWLVDNADAYDALLSAIRRARRSVWMSQLAFDADCVAYDDDVSEEEEPARRIIDALVEASAERAVEVRILLNASLLLDTATPLREFLHGEGASRVQVRGVARFPQLLHAKMVVIDGVEAFLVGSPFVNGYWDDSHHRPFDARRPARELGGRPLHDLSCAVTGPAVAALEGQFAELWNDVSASPEEHRSTCIVPGEASPEAIRVVRTAPRRVIPAHPDGLAEILSEIETGLAAARSLVYVEHQYLSARPVIDALVAALAREPSLEVIMVLNQNPDVTAYRVWQNARIREAGLLAHPRVGMFALWSLGDGSLASHRDINQIFVHSKVLAVDDIWATVGSANLDGVSLHSYGDDFEGLAGRRVFRHVRNFDVNLTFDDRDDALSGAVRDLRTRLWSEHLGLAPRRLAARPADGWLAFWRACAARNVAAFAGGHDATPAGSVLPYSTRSTPREQLADLGIDPSHAVVHFDPGWLEVHCSPNWVRNMFA
jgi:phosphatidylserine/phosphatidylglycerophosphate/cardiolipin synthase-like enzyme